MEYLADNKMLKFRSDTLETVRRAINLDKSSRMKEAIDILEKWVQMQPHFVKKDFSREYLERTLISAKGLVERAKERLEKLCTFKSLIPEFFTVSDVKKDFTPLQNVILTAHLPKLTPEHYRVFIVKVVSETNLDSSVMFTFYKYLTMLGEYFKRAEYCSGFVTILDTNDVKNIMNPVTKINPMELRQIISLITEGYGSRIKGIHIITTSKTMDKLTILLKQVFSAKLVGRIHTHKKVESVHEFVPKDILPVDYDGEDKSLKELHSDWLEQIGSKEFQYYFKEMSKANTNECFRQLDKFNENYVGMPGSFRALSID